MGGRFNEAVVFITGGTSGLGAQTCERFLGEGATVFVTDLKVFSPWYIKTSKISGSLARLKPTDKTPLSAAIPLSVANY